VSVLNENRKTVRLTRIGGFSENKTPLIINTSVSNSEDNSEVNVKQQQ